MSRIDDDRDAARQAERIAEQRRMEDKRRVDKQAGDSAFARLVGDAQKQEGHMQRANTQRTWASGADAKFVEKADPFSAERVKEDGERVLGRQGLLGHKKPHAVLQQLIGKTQADSEFPEGNKPLSQKVQKQGAQNQAHMQQVTKLKEGERVLSKEQSEVGKKSAQQTESQAEARSVQSKADDKRHAQVGTEARRARAEEKASDMRQASSAKPSEKEEKRELGSVLSTNPALMEPPPVVRPKPTGDSERLRRLASEIAQKIVERVRVGTNKAGNAEFQIDLRSDVLSGLSLRVSSSSGKISVVFSSADRNALKTVEEQSDALRNALSVRGLTLTDLKLETIS